MRLGKPTCRGLLGLARMSDPNPEAADDRLPNSRYEPLGQHYGEVGGQRDGLTVVPQRQGTAWSVALPRAGGRADCSGSHGCWGREERANLRGERLPNGLCWRPAAPGFSLM